jgi:hypothetical protein
MVFVRVGFARAASSYALQLCDLRNTGRDVDLLLLTILAGIFCLIIVFGRNFPSKPNTLPKTTRPAAT